MYKNLHVRMIVQSKPYCHLMLHAAAPHQIYNAVNLCMDYSHVTKLEYIEFAYCVGSRALCGGLFDRGDTVIGWNCLGETTSVARSKLPTFLASSRAEEGFRRQCSLHGIPCQL